MATRGVADAESAAHAEAAQDAGQVAAEVAPSVRRIGPGATAVAPRFHRQATPPRQTADDVIPQAAVEPGGVRENQRRIRARPFPKSEIEAVDIDDAQLRTFLGGAEVHW